MKTISHAQLIERFETIAGREEAERLLGLALMQLGIFQQESYTPEQVVKVSGLLITQGLQETAIGLSAMAPKLDKLL